MQKFSNWLRLPSTRLSEKNDRAAMLAMQSCTAPCVSHPGFRLADPPDAALLRLQLTQQMEIAGDASLRPD